MKAIALRSRYRFRHVEQLSHVPGRARGVAERPGTTVPAVHPAAFFDAAGRNPQDGLVRNKAVYVALALDVGGEKHVSGVFARVCVWAVVVGRPTGFACPTSVRRAKAAAPEVIPSA
jgi:hypothetical protein